MPAPAHTSPRTPLELVRDIAVAVVAASVYALTTELVRLLLTHLG